MQPTVQNLKFSDIPKLFEPGGIFESAASFYHTLADIWVVVKIVAVPLSLLLLVGIVYTIIRINQVLHLDKTERQKEEDVARAEGAKRVANRRWDHITNLINSEKEGDWRLAILEADVMLDELVSSMGYTGDSLGEMLKQVEKSDFNTIDDAWEAHKVRNTIAHEGSEFRISQREAQRVIRLFENVFNEFEII